MKSIKLILSSLSLSVVCLSSNPASAQISKETDELIQRNLRRQEAREFREYMRSFYHVEPLFPDDDIDVNIYGMATPCLGLPQRESHALSTFVGLAIAKRSARTGVSEARITQEWLTAPLHEIYRLAAEELAR